MLLSSPNRPGRTRIKDSSSSIVLEGDIYLNEICATTTSANTVVCLAAL